MKTATKLLAFVMICVIVAASFAACSEKRILVIDDYTSGSAASDDASVDPSDETTAYIGQTPGGSTSSSGKINGTYGNETMPDDIYVSPDTTTYNGNVEVSDVYETERETVETTHYIESGYVAVEHQGTICDGLSLLYEKKDGSKKFTHLVVSYFQPDNPIFPAPSATDVIIPDEFDNLPVEGIENSVFENSDIVTIVIPASIHIIKKDAFKNCEDLTAVYYQGSEAEWALISIGRNNDSLLAATRYYYSEAEPTVEGNFWHYVDGVPTVWGAQA